MRVSTLDRCAALKTFRVPSTFVFQASCGWVSSSGEVLQGCCVEYQIRPDVVEDLVDTLRVTQVGQFQVVPLEQCLTRDAQLDRVQRGFVAVQHHQTPWTQLGDLSAQLRADGAAGTGHQNDLARHERRDRGHVDLHRMPAEDVGRVDFADLARRGVTPDQFGDRRKGVDLQSGRTPGAVQIADQRGIGGRDRDQKPGRTVVRQRRTPRPAGCHARARRRSGVAPWRGRRPGSRLAGTRRLGIGSAIG